MGIPMIDKVLPRDPQAGQLFAIHKLCWKSFGMFIVVSFEGGAKFMVKMQVWVFEALNDGVIRSMLWSSRRPGNGFNKLMIPPLVLADPGHTSCPRYIPICKTDIAFICAHKGTKLNVSCQHQIQF